MTVKDIMFILVLLPVVGAPPTYFDHVCSNNATLTTLTNLNILLSHLIYNASLHDGFYRTATGMRTPDAVTGLFLCRGDVTAAVCQTSVAAAVKEISRLCPNKTESIVWFDACMLRYSNSTYLNSITPSVSSADGENIGSLYVKQFKETLASMLNDIAVEAANSLTQKKLATQQRKFGGSRTLYGLPQCTPDLSAFDCMMCLRSGIGAVPMCCDGKQGGRVLLPGCNVRYQLYPFYNIKPLTSAAVGILPSRSDAHKQRELDWNRRYSIIIGIARGVQYLHEDSQLRVVHRDLKTGNVLLDSNMKPKVSDFGTAKIIHGDQTQAKTRRIVGTLHGKLGENKHLWRFWIRH